MSDRLPGWKFAAFAVICAVAAAWLFSVLSNARFFADEVRYEAVLADVAGLHTNDSVTVSGVRVGRVRGMHLEDGRAVVEFDVDADLPVTDTWELAVRWRNVLGQRYLQLYPAGDGQRLEPGARLPVEQTRVAADVGLLVDRLSPVLRAIRPDQANELITALNAALAGREERARRIVDDLGTLSGALASRDAEIHSVIDQSNALLGEYAAQEEAIRAIIADLADLAATLEPRNDELLGAIADIATAQRALGDLLDDNDAELRAVTADLAEIGDALGLQDPVTEDAVESLRHGLASYMLISRWGQWFNIRAVAVQVQHQGEIVFCQTEAGEPCAEPSGPAAEGASMRGSGIDALFGIAAGGDVR